MKNIPITSKQVKELSKGFYPDQFENRSKRRQTEQKDHNNRKGINRVMVHGGKGTGRPQTKVTRQKQFIGNKMVIHYI